ncbi:CHAT domain-containing protein [Kribbella sp. CWNU-51]
MAETRATARLRVAMALAAENGDDTAWLTAAHALQAALERADPDGSGRRDLWNGIVATSDRLRLRAHSREGRLSDAGLADELIGPLLRDALDDDQVDVATVFMLAEAARSRVLLDTLAGAQHGDSGHPDEAAYAARVVAFAPDLDDSPADQELMLVSAVRHVESPELQADRAAALATLESLYADGDRGFRGGIGTASLRDIQDALGPTQVLVEYVIPYHPLHPAHDLVALVVTRDVATVIPLTVPSSPEDETFIGSISVDGRRPMDVSPLGNLTSRARAAIQGDNPAAAHAFAHLLHRFLVQPILDTGAPNGRTDWIIVPHRQLHPCPWMALVDADGLPWLATTTVTVCPSASVWLHLRRSPRAGHAALALGNPLLGYAGLPALPAAADEVEHLHQVWTDRGWPIEARIGSQATSAALEAGAAAANVVHIATHGSFPTAAAAANHQLFLGLGRGSPGSMDLSRIRALDLKGSWCTTLSICDGGIYLVGPGDELLGMAAAVLEAGSSTIVAAQWKVDDDACRRLMRHVVEALGSAGPAQALRIGALNLAAEDAPPREWAAFLAIGDGSGPAESAD